MAIDQTTSFLGIHVAQTSAINYKCVILGVKAMMHPPNSHYLTYLKANLMDN